jgi:nucleotide-binding universal stress UspA family protein
LPGEKDVDTKIRKILFPTDFSEYGDDVLAFATSLARDNDATLLIAHAIDMRVPDTGVPIAPAVPAAPLPPHDVEGEKEQLKQICPADERVRYEHRLVDGAPSQAILELIEEEGVDLVVMGTHGRTGLSRLLMGSVAEAVVRQAKCPVLTLRPSVAAEVQPSATASAASKDVVESSPGPAEMHESMEPTESEREHKAQDYLG